MTPTPVRWLPAAVFLALAFGLALLLLAASFLFGPQAAAIGKPGMAAISAAAIIAAGALACIHWRRLDEPAREAHKSAWFWGGTTGLAAVSIGLAALMFAPSASDAVTRYIETQRGHIHPTAFGLMLGFMACLLGQMLGYGVAWVRWWAKRRA